MAELNESTGLNALVDKDKFEYGEVSPTSIISYEFPFKGNADQIEYIEKGCGCTQAYFDDGKVQGTLDLGKANGNQEYPKGETVISKYVFVWLNDGKPRFISDAKKQKQQNPAKSYFKLEINAVVVN